VIDRRGMLTLLLAAPLAGCSETATKDTAHVLRIDELSETGAVPDVLRVGVPPSSGSKTAERLQPLFDFLARELGSKVEGKTAANYDDLAKLVNKGEVEVGIFSPLAFVKARYTLDAVPIATATRRGSPTYLGYLVIRRDDVMASGAAPPQLESLRGERVAWVDESSTSGYLYPRALLRGRGFDPDSFFAAEPLFAGNHAAALKALHDRKVDVAAAASPFVDPDSDSAVSFASELVVVAKTERIPHDCVVVHKRLQRQLGKDVRDALRQLHKDRKASDALDKSWGLGGFVPPISSSYDLIEAVRQSGA